MTAPLDRIERTGVVAICRGLDPADADPVAEAVVAGGVEAIEVTANSDDVAGQIRTMCDAVGDRAAVGAGTVLDAETARAAILAGASFVVTPTVDEGVVETCNRYGVPTLVGAASPTETLRAVEAGADVVKVFPASDLGVDYVRSLGGPLGHVPLAPTGGVDLDNVDDFFAAGASAVGVGSALVDRDAIETGDFDELTDRARRFRERADEWL